MRNLAVIITTLFSLLVLLTASGCSHHIKTTKRPAIPKLPRVDGEIIGAKVSPDHSRIAVEWQTANGVTKVLILDPAKRSILVQGDRTWLSGAKWSPDSRWLATFDGPKDMLLLGEQGEKRAVHTQHRVTSFAWPPSTTDRIFYSTDQDGSGVYEVTISKGIERRIDFGHSIINLFTHRGAVCVAYFQQAGSANGYFYTGDSNHTIGVRQDAVRVSDLASRKEIFRVPLKGEQPWKDGSAEPRWNDYYFETSPDGRYFFIHGSLISDGGVNAIARVTDVGRVFASQEKALVFSQDRNLNETRYSVYWLDADKAIVDTGLSDIDEIDAEYLPFLLDLRTDNRKPLPSHLRVLDIWEPKLGLRGRLVVTKAGLEIPKLNGSGRELILRHRMLKK